MLGKLIAAIQNFLSSLFGGKSNRPAGPASPGSSRPANKPRPLPPPEPNVAQDGSEVQPDTVIIVAHEMEEVVILPGETDQDFDEDVVVEETPAPEPVAEPTPSAEPEAAPEPVPAPTGHQPRYLWCLDNGHGSQTAGKRSPVFDDGETQFMEYEFNRDIVNRIIPQLEAKGVQYFNVVPEVDIDNFLEGRVERANNKASDLPKIFVSVHSNAAPARSSNDWGPDSVSGIETWFYHGSKRGQKIAAIFQKHLIEKTGLKNRHLKSRPDRQFYVLRKTAMPAVLTENGFYNNKAEAAKLMTDAVRQQIADAHVAAIVEIEEHGL
jgi:N-acetylmuramoyl-L-alanine amidase